LPIDLKDEKEWSPLHYAAYSANPGLVKVLLDSNADVNQRNNRGRTPFHELMSMTQPFWRTSLSAITTLVEHGADGNQKDNDGVSPLDIAVK